MKFAGPPQLAASLFLSGMSAVGPKRTFTEPLLDHLIGEGEQRRRNSEAERPGGLEVDDELEFGGLHDREVGGLLAVENPAGVDADLAIGISDAGPVAHQATGYDVFAQVITRR